MTDDTYYTNINNNIRSTDDISFKLLGIVPLFSGSGILVAILKSEYFWSTNRTRLCLRVSQGYIAN